VTSRKTRFVPAAVQFRQGIVYGLREKRPAALVKRFLVAEVAGMRTAARHDNRIGDEVQVALDQVTPDGWDADQ